MTGKQLKNSILQWAIQGKLVPQDPNDEPASVLLERIREEKARLIKEKKIKKDKNESIIYRGDDNSHYEKILATGEVKCIDDEIPFEIPDSWMWCRLGQILTVKGGKRIPVGCSFAPSATSHIYIRVTEMKNNTLIDKDLKYINEDVFEKIKNYTIGKDDLYLTIAGTIGSVGVVPEKFDGMNLTENAVKLTNLMTNKMFLLYVISSTLVQSQFIDKTKQVAQPKLAIERIQTTLIPFPPLDEQEKIVTKIEELLRIIEHYNLALTQLDTLNGEINNLLKKSILQEAIQGRLVPQIDSEESATVLLEKIKEEKSRLVKEGKLKKKDLTDSTIFKGDDNKYYEKCDNTITCIDAEIPFDIPESWQWVRLNLVANIARGGSPRPIKEFLTDDQNGVNWIKIGDTEKDGKFINSTKEKIKPEGVSKSRLIHKGDFLLTNSMSFGRPYISNIDGCVHDGWLVISPLKNCYNTDFLYYLLSSRFAYTQFCGKVSGAVVQNLNSDKVANAIFPLPSIAEQQRIVVKIEQVLTSIMSR